VTDWFSQLDPDHGESGQPGRPSWDHEVKKARTAKTRRRILAVGITLVAAVGVAAVTVMVVLPFMESLRSDGQSISDYPGPGGESVQVVVNPGDGGAAIAETLKQADVVATAKAFVDAYNANPKAQSIQPGTYSLASQMRAADAVASLVDGGSRLVVKFTIPEGWRASQIYKEIAKQTGLSVDDLRAAAKDGAAIDLPEQAEGQIEGWLFPATYEFDPDPTPVEILTRMIDRMEAELKRLGAEPEEWRDAVILASMVEKEAKLEDDRPKVARVFLNRIKQGMNLQSDATVSYGVKDFSSVYTSDADRADDNKWNTYLHPGLPGGAICSPGEASLTAALNPQPGKWLFFVVVNLETGETKYAKTVEGHARNVERLHQWEAENGDE
jgi:UPF0755 protein